MTPPTHNCTFAYEGEERGLAIQHCHSFTEAIDAANDEYYRRNMPGYNAPPLTITNLGGLIVARPA